MNNEESKPVTARTNIPAVLCHGFNTAIAKGTRLQPTGEKWFNGEGWYMFGPGRKIPSIFFDEEE
jgi:hypothetical protein